MIEKTRVWDIDNTLVVAPTLADAIRVYKTFKGNDEDPTDICGVWTGEKDYNAIEEGKSSVDNFMPYAAMVKEEK